MKHSFKLSLTLLAGLVLTACGSSGGSGSGSDSAAKKDEKPVVSQPAKPAEAAKPAANNGEKSGGSVVISADKAKVVDLKQPGIRSIDVEGKEITLTYPGIISGSWMNINNESICCGKYSSVRFGASEGDNTYLFYNGVPTASMPTSGKASYDGRVIARAHGFLTKGNSHFDADFGSKKLTGKFSEFEGVPHPVNIDVTADINGNDFKGTASTGRNPAALEGKFFGQNAKELGGVFSDGEAQGFSGAFGAAQK